MLKSKLKIILATILLYDDFILKKKPFVFLYQNIQKISFLRTLIFPQEKLSL